MSYQGRYSRQKPPKQSSGKKKKIAITVICILLVLIVGIGSTAFFYMRSKLGKMTKAEYRDSLDTSDLSEPVGYFDPTEETESESETETEEAATETTVPDYGSGKILNILLIGQDSREGEDSKLADAIILATVNKETKTLTMTSFLRDTFLKMPDYKGHTCGKNRINVNYALGYTWAGDLGAMEMLDLCIYNNFGVEIDGNIVVGFDAFENVVNYLEGIDVVMSEEEAEYMENLDFLYDKYYAFDEEEHLDGWEALAYVRMRHSSNSDNDFRRTERQRAVLGQMLDKVKDLTPAELNEVVDMIMPMIVTDMDADTVMTYIMECIPLLPSIKLVANQCPVEGSAHGELIDIYGDGMMSSVLIPDVQANRRVLMEICEGVTVP